uniref:Sorting nexin-1/2 n=1 Tax=Tetraselmis sp. GSL018 TaxID=582737 RepID=A0A061QU72_9CHLO
MEDPLSALGDCETFGEGQAEDELPPPPYDSLVLNNSQGAENAASTTNQASSSSFSRPKRPEGPRDFDIYVTDPVKQGDGVGAYVSYKVWTKTRLQQFKNSENEVIRRYKDFDWLFHRLQSTNRGVFVPAIPEKNAVSKISATTDFIEGRRRGLQSFINKVAEHPVLKYNSTLQLFLEGSEIEWRTEVDRVNSQEKNVGSKLSETLQFFKDLQHSASNIVSGKSDDEEEDPEYLKVKEYITLLEGHLSEAHRQAMRLTKKQSKMADALAGFGSSSQALSVMEDGHVKDAFQLLGSKSEELAKTIQEETLQLGVKFEEPLKEFCRMVKCVKAVMADRSSALAMYQQCKQDVWAKRNKLTKLKGTPGVKEEKVSHAERDLNEATSNAEKAKEEYDVIVGRMNDELVRFQKERAADIGEVLKEFALAQAKLASDTAKAWQQVIPQISPR